MSLTKKLIADSECRYDTHREKAHYLFYTAVIYAHHQMKHVVVTNTVNNSTHLCHASGLDYFDKCALLIIFFHGSFFLNCCHVKKMTPCEMPKFKLLHQSEMKIYVGWELHYVRGRSSGT